MVSKESKNAARPLPPFFFLLVGFVLLMNLTPFVIVFVHVTEFTGISAPYEAPPKPEVHIRSDQTSVDDAVKQLVAYLEDHKII
jgi:hypothetical protein